VKVYRHVSESFWSQSVSEFALGLTICGLRRIPQTHQAITASQAPWKYVPGEGQEPSGARDKISLAADAFNVEPLPLEHPLLGRHNVVHTPHNAGRTIDANQQWAELLAQQFLPMSTASN
jgi:phosphoglycerate dehydrogenase-like enzyme